jgi:hypothetical protein
MARGGWGQGRRVLVNAARPLTAPGVNAPSRKDLVHPVALGRGLPVFSDLAMPRASQADELEGLSGGLGGADLSAGVNASEKARDRPPSRSFTRPHISH